MAIAEAKTCPRKAFLHNKVPSGVIKASVLRKIMRDVLLSTDFSVKIPALEKRVDDAFEAAAAAGKMFDFERDSECARMKQLLRRYIAFEGIQENNTILAQDFANTVTVLKKSHQITAHRLIDRGEALECIQYIYKAPQLRYNASKQEFKVSLNPDLLALQLCGEAEAAKLGIKKPVYGAFYYLKSSKDRSSAPAPFFEDAKGANIINYHFVHSDITLIEQLYEGVKEEAGTCAEDARNCYDCLFKDLCHTEFNKRKQTDMPVVEETPLNDIRLTRAQQKFVGFDHGECRVNAVAGSGKTASVTLRTLRLLEDGCAPEDILMVTFTEKGAEEMRSRLRRYAKGAAYDGLDLDTDKIVVSTFNGFGQNLLEQHYAKLGFTKAPALVDEVVKKDILVELLSKHNTLPFDYRNPFLNLPNARGAVVQAGEIIDAMKANHVETAAEAEVMLGSADLKARATELLEIYQEYNRQLVEKNMIDFEDQLRLLLALKSYGVFDDFTFRHIIIDEFQDSNPVQIELILEMAKADKNLESIVVVGDEMQAIYGFRNATPENLVNFGTYFPGMIDIPFEENFRSQSPIIAMANNILDKEARIARVIRATRKERGLDPVVMTVDDADKERDLYARQAEKLIRDGTDPKDIAILCRTKTELLAMQKALDDRGIPTILRVPEIVADAPYVKAIIAVSSFLLNHENLIDLALYRKSLGQNPFDTAALEADAKVLGEAYDTLETEEDRILFFTELIKDAREDYVAEAFADEVLQKGFHTAKQIMEFCVKYRDYGVRETKSTAREDVDAVTLITVHSAKGLEWPVVLLSLRKFRPASEEEHRLLYVAVTRAKEKLLITHTKKQETLTALLA